MAQWSKRKVTTARHEYVVAKPCNWVEMHKALDAAASGYKEITRRPLADDSMWVTSTDEEIIIYWEQDA